jgi:hypothetical protein
MQLKAKEMPERSLILKERDSTER